MNYTWGEIQIISLQKMFLNNTKLEISDLPTMRDDKTYKIYLNSMANIANEGLLRLMTIGRPVVKKYTLTHNIPKEVLNYQTFETFNIINDDLVVSGIGSKAYYFEVNNTCTIKIQSFDEEWEDIETIEHTSTIYNQYTSYKKRITNENNKPIRIIFEADGTFYNVRNIALYNIKFASDEEVLDNTRKQKYNLSDSIDDFYKIISIEFESLNNPGKYNSDFIIEGDNTLIIDKNLNGNFIISYQAYPDKITDKTKDNYKFNMSGEMISLLPLYIASEIYKDDDISMATMYRNQFELGLDKVMTIREPLEFKNNTGWL